MMKMMRDNGAIVILVIVMGLLLTACSNRDNRSNQTSEITDTDQTPQKTEDAQTVGETMNHENTAAESQIESAANIDIPILDEINQNLQVGTTGAYMTAIQEAVKMLDWGTETGLDTQEIREATTAWLMNKGNDEQVDFAEKLRQVDDAYHKLLGSDAKSLMESAGCESDSYPWSDTLVEPIEAVMDAVGLRPYEGNDASTEEWKVTFENSLMENYQVMVDHYEDLGDGVYQVYVVINGKTVPYVTVDSKTGDYHG